MVGASLALALRSLPIRLAMVEPVPFKRDDQPSFDARTVALSRSSQRILDSMGIWSAVSSHANPIRRIHISERGRFGNAVIDGAEQGVGDLGYVVESRALGAVIWQALDEQENLRVYSPARLSDVEIREQQVRGTLDTGSDAGQLTARLLVVADGARSTLRQALGIDATTRPYYQTAVVGNVTASRVSSTVTAYERFTPAGPMALLPMGNDRFAFILTRKTDVVAEVLELGDAQFLELLQATFGYRLGRFSRVGARSSYPLSLVRADQVTAGRTVIVGNAANGLHPVAGQGYNLSLRDVASLAELIADHQSAGEPGIPTILHAYKEWRYRDQRNVAAFTDGLVRLFDLPLNSLGIARGLGLLAFDILPGAKRTLARYTMGLEGRLNRLARGLPL